MHSYEASLEYLGVRILETRVGD